MFGYSTAASPAQLLPFFEPLERRYFLAADFSLETGGVPSFSLEGNEFLIYRSPDPIAESIVISDVETYPILAADFSLEAGGIFTNPFHDYGRGEMIISGVDSDVFNWGEAADGGDNCALIFVPQSASTAGGGEFSIGTISFHNSATIGGEAASVVFAISLRIGEENQTLMVPLGIDNTANTDDPEESEDAVFLEGGPIVGDIFTDSSGQRLAVVIVGFGPSDGDEISEEIYSGEDGDATMEVFARIIPEEMIDADWLRSADVPQWLEENRVDEEDAEEEEGEDESDEQWSDEDEGEDDSSDEGDEDEVFDDESDDELDDESDQEVWEDE